MESTTVEQQDRELRAQLHGIWSAVADGWAEHADYVDERAGAVTERMLELAAPQPGERLLELACGPGGLGLAAAELVGAGGHVVLSDVAAEMTSIAAERAAERGLTNVSTAVLDLEEIDQLDASFDVVVCREGLMFVADPARAAREITRVLRPGGRAVVAVWGPRDRNPWLGLVLDSVGAELGMPFPPPGMPGPFALEDSSRLAELLDGAGLAGVDVSDFEVPLRAASFEDWWTRTIALAGPLAKMLPALPANTREAIRARAREATAPYASGAGVEFPGVTLLAVGVTG